MRERWVPLRHGATIVRRPNEKTAAIGYFRGDDLGRSPMNVDRSRSPGSRNMIRDELGRVRKRMGYRTVASYPGAIRGAHPFAGETLIHAGTGLYRGAASLGAMADAHSVSQLLGERLCLLDGQSLRFVTKSGDAFSLCAARTQAYVPTVILSRSPDGGGAPYEDYNLIGARFCNSFYGAAGVTVYALTDGGLDADAVTAEVLNASGVWVQKTEGTDFSVDRATGIVTFAAAPGASPIEGEDNVRIAASKTRAGYADRIDKCTVAALYGVGGAADRLFVSGNPDWPGIDWYSARSDPTYFGDLCYAVLGQGDAPIVGYSIVSDRLAAHKGGARDGRNVVLRRGAFDEEGEAVFPIVGTLQGEGAIAPRACAYLGGEPLFLTRAGVCAIAPSDLTGERYSQLRSAFLNAKLLAEEGLSGACACVYRDFYLLFVNGHVYALDGLQRAQLSGEPYSTHQYEGYYLDHVPACAVWVRRAEDADVLCFGTETGNVCEFYRDKADPLSYNDDGAAIPAHWDTPYLCGEIRHTRKVFSYFSATLAPSVATTLTVYAKTFGIWRKLFTDAASARYFDFNSLDFSKFSFSTDTGPVNVRRKIRIGVVDKTMFRLENNEKNEPFGLYDLTVSYTETGKL